MKETERLEVPIHDCLLFQASSGAISRHEGHGSEGTKLYRHAYLANGSRNPSRVPQPSAWLAVVRSKVGQRTRMNTRQSGAIPGRESPEPSWPEAVSRSASGTGRLFEGEEGCRG